MKIPEKLTTERLIIRPFDKSDKDKFLEFMDDKEATKYLNFTEEQKTPEGASQLFDYILQSYDTEEEVFSLAIERKGMGYVGSCGISPIDDGIYECYYSLNREYWGNGYATEAMEKLLDYCFNELKIDELRAYMSPDNPYSSSVAENIGMEYQGVEVHPVFENEGKMYTIQNK